MTTKSNGTGCKEACATLRADIQALREHLIRVEAMNSVWAQVLAQVTKPAPQQPTSPHGWGLTDAVRPEAQLEELTGYLDPNDKTEAQEDALGELKKETPPRSISARMKWYDDMRKKAGEEPEEERKPEPQVDTVA